jgi:hypothetical protein
MGALDVQVAVKRDAADNIIAEVELMKDGPQGGKFTSRLEVVEVGTDDDGDKITSCVVMPVESATPGRKDKPVKLTKGAKNALAALREAISDLGKVPPAANHIPSGVKCVTKEQWEDYFERRYAGSKDAVRMAFKRGSESLQADDEVACWAPYVWLAK